MKRIIVSGLTGVIGRTILRKLQKDNYEINAIVRTKGKLKKADNVFEYSLDEYKRMFNNETVDAVLNLAFPRSSEKEVLNEGLRFTYEFIEKAITLKPKIIINISSQSVYTDKRTRPASEDDILKPNNLYGTIKAWIELWIEKICKNRDINCVNLRIANIIGQGYRKRLTTRLVNDAIKNGEMIINNEESIFSFLEVDDCADAILSVLENEGKYATKKYNIYNVGTKEKYSMRVLAEKIKKQVENIIKKEIKIRNGKNNGGYTNRSLNTKRFNEEYGWSSNITIEESIFLEIKRQLRGEI